jgi:hypothetical protein
MIDNVRHHYVLTHGIIAVTALLIDRDYGQSDFQFLRPETLRLDYPRLSAERA